jgi:hypothetical protein
MKNLVEELVVLLRRFSYFSDASIAVETVELDDKSREIEILWREDESLREAVSGDFCASFCSSKDSRDSSTNKNRLNQVLIKDRTYSERFHLANF